MTTTTPPPRLTWLRACLLGVGPTVLAVAVSWWLIDAWRPELPARIAIHFGADSVADGFVSLDVLRWQLLLPLAVVVPLFLLVTLVTRRELTSARWLMALTSAPGVFVAVLILALVEGQRGLDSAAGHQMGGGALLLATGVAVGVAAAVAVSVPRAPRVVATTGPGADAPRIRLDPRERVAWVASAQMPAWLLWPIALLALVLLPIPALMEADPMMWIAILVASVAIVSLLTAMVVCPLRVRIDDHGVHVQAPLTGRRTTIETAEIISAEAVTVPFLNSYGGFGYRVGPAGVGYIMRPGVALRIHRAGASAVTMTVDDADQAAGLLNSLIERSRPL